MFNLKQFNANLCLDGDGGTYSYAEVQHISEVMALAFDSRSLILCICENSVSSLLGYITFVTHGHVPILIDSGQISTIIQYIINQYKPDYVWMLESKISSILGYKIVHSIGTYVLLKSVCKEAQSIPLNENLQLLLTTSGSTGSNKFVRISRNNLISNASSIKQYLSIDSQDVAVTTLPYSYSFGLSIINSHLLAGASIQITQLSPMSRDFWKLIEQKKVTSISGVPYTFQMLKKIKFERFNLDSVRYLSQAGGKLNQECLKYLIDISKGKNIPCFVMYGQTEASPRMSYLPPENLDTKQGSIGIPIPGGRFEIIEEDGNIVSSAFKKGELRYYGPNVAMGYSFELNDLSRGDEWNNILNTGDIAYRDDDGFYYIAGRLKRFVKLFGNRVSLDEVESFLHETFVNCEFICFGSDDCLKIGYVGEVDVLNMEQLLSRKLTVNKVAFKFQSLVEIPKLINGKVNFNYLNDLDTH